MNLDLLKPFDIKAAKCGEEVLYVYTTGNTEDTKFVAEAGIDGDHACRDTEGNIFLANEEDLRMRPLAWVEDRPVYKGDVLYWKDDGMVHEPYLGTDKITASLTWTKPEPVKKTRTVKFLGWMSGSGELVWYADDKVWNNWERVPSEDKTCEVEG